MVYLMPVWVTHFSHTSDLLPIPCVICFTSLKLDSLTKVIVLTFLLVTFLPLSSLLLTVTGLLAYMVMLPIFRLLYGS